METLSAYLEIIEKVSFACKKANRTDVPELVAVSKFQSIDKMLDLYRQGQKTFGENYVQELIEKKEKLSAQNIYDLDFHFIGHLQSNKVKLLLPHVNTIHSVDSIRLLNEIEKRANELNKKIKIYMQVNLDLEESKGGFQVDELSNLSQKVAELKNVTCLGLMAIPNPDGRSDEAFQRMKDLSLLYREKLGSGLSMGMSQDYEVAILHGATSLRIGSAIFGARPKMHGA